MRIKKSITLISIGVFNIIHSVLHILQFIQSILLISISTDSDKHSIFEEILHNPIMIILFGVLGIISLYQGVTSIRKK